MTAAPVSLDLPRPRRKYTFVLTPLADAMFQLLIFFMLTSSLTPYSLLTIRSGAPGEAVSPDGAGPAETPAIAANATIWNVRKDEIVAGGQAFAFSALPDLASAVAADASASVLLIARPEAEVQDLTAVLEALTVAGISGVQIATQGGDGG